MAVPCNSKWLMTIYLYNINNMFFSVLCADSEVLDRMNCPPLCAVNPTNHAVLLLVGFENTLRAPDHVLPCFHETHLAFSAPRSFGGGQRAMDHPGQCCSEPGFARQSRVCSLLPPRDAERSFYLQRAQSWEGWNLPAVWYIAQIKTTLSKHENTSIISFLILTVSLETALALELLCIMCASSLLLTLSLKCKATHFLAVSVKSAIQLSLQEGDEHNVTS